ncbi:MAG: hypothetical protein JNK82_18835, partial [Myxococcaceae bacterium]|nr:hypothetical protein [Myxococcaceae bacterium]
GMCFPRCGPLQVDCGGACISIDRDPLHCGACGRPCPPGNGCLNAQCTPACTAPLSVCDAGPFCADLRFDPLNCGGCGVVCPLVPNAAPACSPAGCGRTQCDPGFADCDAGTNDGCETSLGVDPENCGACGRACFGSQMCLLGRCCEQPPAGSYLDTCVNCEACNGLLTCQCQDDLQVLRPTSIPLGPCSPMGFQNCNGVLQCNGC